MVNIKELSKRDERLGPGHRMCPGCPATIIARLVMHATDNPIVVTNATGCLEVSTTIYPFTSWRVPWMHNAFENAAATLSGLETAYKALKKTGRAYGDKEVKFLAFGGDGGTYDIGLQALSGTLERGHNIVYVCYDNQGYMNTGIQRSSSTPMGAATNTSPDGSLHHGKEVFKKDLTAITVAHGIKYVAQASPSHYADMIRKAQTAFEVDGPVFINIISPCVPGWGYPPEESIQIAKLAVETCYWPIYEVVNGEYKLNYDPAARKKPITEWLKTQARFRHMLKPENAHLVTMLQEHVDKEWEKLKKLCGK
ncbi:pyruvate ferredoxin oxidoreductase [Candidatus Woesearchaeota archaeon]|nr:pyruvate ferredoxin oxidoreductase [Candidatus Woesearchaeota archaeon]